MVNCLSLESFLGLLRSFLAIAPQEEASLRGRADRLHLGENQIHWRRFCESLGAEAVLTRAGIPSLLWAMHFAAGRNICAILAQDVPGDTIALELRDSLNTWRQRRLEAAFLDTFPVLCGLARELAQKGNPTPRLE